MIKVKTISNECDLGLELMLAKCLIHASQNVKAATKGGGLKISTFGVTVSIMVK